MVEKHLTFLPAITHLLLSLRLAHLGQIFEVNSNSFDSNVKIAEPENIQPPELLIYLPLKFTSY